MILPGVTTKLLDWWMGNEVKLILLVVECRDLRKDSYLGYKSKLGWPDVATWTRGLNIALGHQ